VVVWTHQSALAPRFCALTPVRRMARWSTSGSTGVPDLAPYISPGDVCVYHLGDDAEAHGRAWLLSQQHPGLVVAHASSYERLFRGLPGDATEALGQADNAALGLAFRGAHAVMTLSKEVHEAARWTVAAPVAYHPGPATSPGGYVDALLRAVEAARRAADGSKPCAPERLAPPADALAPRVREISERFDLRVRALSPWKNAP